MVRRIFIVVLVVTWVIVAADAHAQSLSRDTLPAPSKVYPPPPRAQPVASEPPPVVGSIGWHKHDGIFFGTSVGFGGFRFSMAGGGAQTEIFGTTYSVDLSVGCAITPHLILFGSGYETISTDNPTLRVGGNTMATPGVIDLVSFGPGATYYLGERNYFVSTVVSFSQITFERVFGASDRPTTSRWGPSWKTSIGKEWWASENWGLGLGAQAILGSMKDNRSLVDNYGVGTSSSPSRWVVAAFTLLFTASFN